MADKIREFWYQWIPGWLPVVVAIVSAAFWVGQQQQSVIDRLKSVEEQVKAIQDYLRNDHQKGYLGPSSGLQLHPSPEDAGGPAIHY